MPEKFPLAGVKVAAAGTLKASSCCEPLPPEVASIVVSTNAPWVGGAIARQQAAELVRTSARPEAPTGPRPAAAEKKPSGFFGYNSPS
jgi:hypothetical protein